MQTFEGKTAVVTGAASGIGLALARAFVGAGARVVLADLEGEALHAAGRDLAAGGGRVAAVPTDVSKPADVEELARWALARFGSVDVLCNNAGICGDLVQWSWRHRLEDWRLVLDVNLGGVIHGIHSFLPIMLDQGTEAHVVNTASMGGLVAPPFLAPYAGSKAAVVAISEALDRELRIKEAAVGVSILCPGSVRTAINRPLSGRADAGQASDGAVRAFAEAASRGIEAGMDPAVVADQTLDAIRAKRLYVFTHPDSLTRAESRWLRLKQDAEEAPTA